MDKKVSSALAMELLQKYDNARDRLMCELRKSRVIFFY